MPELPWRESVPTSRISTSSVISARGLSLVSTSSRMTAITGSVARTVIELFVLLGMITGGIVTPVVVRVIAVSIGESRSTSAY